MCCHCILLDRNEQMLIASNCRERSHNSRTDGAVYLHMLSGVDFFLHNSLTFGSITITCALKCKFLKSSTFLSFEAKAELSELHICITNVFVLNTCNDCIFVQNVNSAIGLQQKGPDAEIGKFPLACAKTQSHAFVKHALYCSSFENAHREAPWLASLRFTLEKYPV